VSRPWSFAIGASRTATLSEDTLDWFAQDAAGNVWYFGENTAECSGGKIASRAGAWMAGVEGAQPGVVMLAQPTVGEYYRQEYLRGEAEDVARVLKIDGTLKNGSTTYKDAVVTEISRRSNRAPSSTSPTCRTSA
jgi:hypothetical protein